MKSKSYKKASCCGEDCYALSSNETCWGEVTVVEQENIGDDFYWVHACEGHLETYFGELYVEEE